MIKIEKLDHLVLTVRDIEATCNFYGRILGMEIVTFGQGCKALAFGKQKINLHQVGQEFEPKADKPTPGSADLCFITTVSINEVVATLNSARIEIIEGPIKKTGAMRPIESVYFRDPDHNLIEVSVYNS